MAASNSRSAQAVLKQVELQLQLASEMEIEASEKACAIADLMHMSADKVDEVRMAVIEACINAIEHSRAEDGKLYVQISMLGHDEPETLEITVHDRGVGFDPKKLVQPNIEDKLKSASKRGWGFRIIEGLMDEVEVESGADGTSVTMRKQVGRS